MFRAKIAKPETNALFSFFPKESFCSWWISLLTFVNGSIGNLGWTNTPKWLFGEYYNMKNAVSMPRECFPKISESMKRNCPGFTHI